MNNILNRIYDEILQHEEDCISSTAKVEAHINSLTAPLKEKLSIEDMEKLNNMLYSTSKISQQEGFILGMKYIVKFIANLIS